MQGAGLLPGYRYIWHSLRLRHEKYVSQRLVARNMKEIYPEGVKKRRGRRLKRRVYISNGPNFCWYIDGNKSAASLAEPPPPPITTGDTYDSVHPKGSDGNRSVASLAEILPPLSLLVTHTIWFTRKTPLALGLNRGRDKGGCSLNCVSTADVTHQLECWVG